jgi:hypothetical protein
MDVEWRMTRLDAMRALLALPIADDHQRVSRAIKGYESADAEKVAIRVMSKRKRKTVKSSRIGWLKGVHERKGA